MMRNSLFEDSLESILYEKPQNSYFDFPQTALSFCYSMKSSHPLYENGCLFRVYGKTKTLVTFDTPENLLKGLEYYRPKKVLPYVNKGIEGIYAGKEFYCEKWDTDGWLSTKQNSGKYSYYLRRATKEFEITNKFTNLEIMDVFNDWVKSAAKRHFMVIKGHYLSYIKRAEYSKAINLLGIRNRKNGMLEAIAGYEICGKKACITIMKNRTIKCRFTDWFWISILEYIFENDNPSIVYCGSTADELKLHLGLSFWKSYRCIYDRRK